MRNEDEDQRCTYCKLQLLIILKRTVGRVRQIALLVSEQIKNISKEAR